MALPWDGIPAPAVRTGTRAAAPWIGVLVVGAGAAALASVGGRALWATGSMGAALGAARGDALGPVVVACVALLFLAERWRPAVRRAALARAHRVDAAYLGLFAVAVLPVLVLVQTGFGAVVGHVAPPLVLGRLPLLPRVLAVTAVLLLMDALNWAAHVANHRIGALWRLHALHHSQEETSVLTTFRTHPLVHATYLGSALPALLLGAGGAVPGAALVGYACLVALAHANLPWTLGPAGRTVVSPAYHRLHHRREGDGVGATNFGFVLVWWDRLAGTAAFPGEDGPPVPTGLAGRPVPVEQAGPTGRSLRTLARQLAQPFDPRDPVGLLTDGGS